MRATSPGAAKDWRENSIRKTLEACRELKENTGARGRRSAADFTPRVFCVAGPEERGGTRA